MLCDGRCNVLRVFADAVDDARFAAVEPGKADEVQAAHGRDSPLMDRPAFCVECWQVYPAKISGEPGGPNNRADPCRGWSAEPCLREWKPSKCAIFGIGLVDIREPSPPGYDAFIREGSLNSLAGANSDIAALEGIDFPTMGDEPGAGEVTYAAAGLQDA